MSAITAKASRKMKKYAVLTREPRCFLGSFDFSWEQRKLGELVDVCSGRDYKHLSEGTIPVYGTGGYMLSVNDALSYDRDAIGIGRKGTIDRPYILKAPFWTVDTLFYAIPREKVDLNYAFDIFQNIDWKKKDESTGVPSLSKTAINDIDVLAPKHDEQQIIGQFFAAIDNLITLHQRKCALLFSPFQALISMMFTTSTFSWEQRKFGEVFDCTVPNNTLSRAELSYDEGTVLNVHYGDVLIKYGSVLDVQKDDIPRIPHRCREDFNGALLQDGDIIIADTAEDETTGKACEISNLQGSVIVSGLHTMVCRPRNRMALGYLGYYLNSNAYHHQLLPLMQGIKVLSLSRSNIQKTSVSYPTAVKEQQHIAYYFSQLDNLITLHQRKCISFTGRAGRLISTVNKKRITSSWEQRKFSELVQIERGGSPRPIDDFITDAPNGLNWIKIGDAPTQGNYITKTAEKIRPEGLSKTREVHPGDLILSNSMSFGKPYIMGIDGCIHDGWLLIRNTYGVFDLTFLCHLLGTPQMLSQYRSLAAGSTVNNLNKELVGNTVVTIPSITEQRVLGDYLEQLDNLITLHQRKPFLMKWRNSDANRNQTNRLVL